MPSGNRTSGGGLYARRKWLRDLWTAVVFGAVVAGFTAGGLYLMYMRQKF